MEQPSPTQPNNNNNFNLPDAPSKTTTTTTTTTPPSTQPHPTLRTRLTSTNPAFTAKLAQMSLQLAPLVQLTTGAVHPAFPRSLLAFWLLTESQLDALAHFYHQRTPGPWTAHYPCPVAWPGGLTIEEKRRKLGRFIGLRGCETPVGRLPVEMEVDGGEGEGEGMGMGMGMGMVVDEAMLGRSEEEIGEEAERARQRGDEVEEVRRKMGWY